MTATTGESGEPTSAVPDERMRLGDWPRWVRWVAYALVGALVLGAVATVAGFVVARRPLPQTDGTIRLDGLSGPVDVVRDANGIPQVYADSSGDLFFAQGFVHAQERFYEMDFRRHLTAGRLSELLGEETVETDTFVRTLGWRRVAEQEWDLLSEETQDNLTSYSAGVNAYLQDRSVTRLSLEYTVLGLSGPDYEPAPWDPIDSLAWLKAMAWDLTSSISDEADRAELAAQRGRAALGALYPAYDYRKHLPILPEGMRSAPARARPVPLAEVAPMLRDLGEVMDAVPAALGTGEGIGSNSWVVSGEHTESGKPLLANDPHLAVSMPGIWMQMGLHCREVDDGCPYDVSGFTFSGFPGVVIGHNQNIAWGFTNLDPDVADLYLEKVQDDAALYDGQWQPLARREEVIRVRGGGSEKIEVRSTRHGPLISDVSEQMAEVGQETFVPRRSPGRGDGYAVALQWTALAPRPTADAIFAFNRAGDWTDFRAAAKLFSVPSQNLLYADIEGNIGYQAPGAVPIRRTARATDYPVIGWESVNDWSGAEVPFESLPSVLNPEEGFIVTANNAVTARGYRYYLGSEWDRGYRSQRIRVLVEEAIEDGPVGVGTMARIQRDTWNPMAPVLTPHLLRQLMTSDYDAEGQRLLVGWDFTQDPDSAPAAYYNAVWKNLLELTFHDQLGKDQWPDGGQRWFAVVSALLDEPTSGWWDDVETRGTIEDRDTILKRSMRAAHDELVQRLHSSPDRWRWGTLHGMNLENQSLGQSGIGPVEALFNRGPFGVGGGDSIVDATKWDAREGYQVTAAPSMRMVVDLDDLDRSRWISLTGVSGHAASEHYRDQTDLYVEGKTLTWAFSKDAVKKSAKETLRLRPT